ncbi:hypothetical protein LZ554_004799 [Drepanopeziza brunnea f. sp. 'monogermtubi']|nr:hypothetical protein LZ554_004799 [Drepanopeziza brunnea f. sp. 'monogermtubi']
MDDTEFGLPHVGSCATNDRRTRVEEPAGWCEFQEAGRRTESWAIWASWASWASKLGKQAGRAGQAGQADQIVLLQVIIDIGLGKERPEYTVALRACSVVYK